MNVDKKINPNKIKNEEMRIGFPISATKALGLTMLDCWFQKVTDFVGRCPLTPVTKGC